jgi:hypothetical protein
MSALDIKQIVYRYNGDAKSDEVVNDLVGEFPRHAKGEIVERNGKQWKVISSTMNSPLLGHNKFRFITYY